MTVKFLEAAHDHLRDAARYYNTQRPGLGKALRAEIRVAVERIRNFPRVWQPLSEWKDSRFGIRVATLNSDLEYLSAHSRLTYAPVFLAPLAAFRPIVRKLIIPVKFSHIDLQTGFQTRKRPESVLIRGWWLVSVKPSFSGQACMN